MVELGPWSLLSAALVVEDHPLQLEERLRAIGGQVVEDRFEGGGMRFYSLPDGFRLLGKPEVFKGKIINVLRVLPIPD